MKKTHQILLLAAMAATALTPVYAVNAAEGTVLVRYDFDSAEEPAAPTETAAGIEASKLTFGETIKAAFETAPPAAVFTPEGGLSIRSDVLPKGVSSEGEHYVEFTLKLPKGGNFEVTGVTLSGRRSGNAPDLYAYPRIRSSFDDFDTVINLGKIVSTDPVRLEQKINGLTVENEVTFRLYLPVINPGNNRVIIDEISLTGRLLP